MNFINRFQSILFYYSLTKEDYEKIHSDMKQGSLGMIIILSGFSFITMVGLFFYSFFFEEWKGHRYVYVVFFTVFLIIYLLSKLNRRLEVFSPNFTIYSFLFGFYSFAAIDSIMYSPDVIAVEPIVILFLVSAFFYFNLFETLLFISAMTVISSVVAVFYSSDAVKAVNINNFVIYGIINLVLSSLINHTYAIGFLNAHRAKEAGYMDFMTGLYNRNYYRAILPKMLGKVRFNLACIYVDANDLHRINNEQGHEAGDLMLRSIAKLMQEMFGKEYTFRIGGDEFVAFVPDVGADFKKTICENYKARIEEKGFHASLGCEVFSKPKSEDMDDLIRAAEEKMYEEKKRFYESRGRDRRTTRT